MNQTLPMCCFCEKVRGEGEAGADEGVWQDLKIYMASREPRPRSTIFSYGCCPDCLINDPRAIAFRARRSQSQSSIRGKLDSSRSMGHRL